MARADDEPETKSSGRGSWLAALAVLVAAAAVAGAVAWRGGEQEVAAQEERAVPVVAAPVARGVARDTVVTVGEVRARKAVTLASEVAGRVVEVAVSDGSTVEAGAVILRLDDERERAALEAAEARAAEALVQFQRTQELTQRNVAADAQLDERRAALRTAQAEATQARTSVERRTVRAPFDGQVGFLLVDPGAFVEPGTAITEITSPPPLRLRFRLPSRFLGELDVGDRVRGSADAYPGVTFEGEVVTIDPTVDRSSRNFAAEAEFRDPQARLRPGMFLDATVVLQERERALLVPQLAVRYEGPTVYVYRIDEEGRARRTPITLGARGDDGMVEVVAGLNEGDRVIVEGVQKVADGARVEPEERSPVPPREGTS